MLRAIVYEREKVPKYTKYKQNNASQVVNQKKEKDYEYYICDYCGEKIEILKKKVEMTGGIANLPNSLTGKGNIQVALCNKCLKPVINELENMRMEKENYNHIPRID